MSFGQLIVDHGETLAAAQAMFQESVARFFVAALGVAAIASVALAIFIGRRVASPLREVSEAAKLIAQGDHAVRVRPRGPEEIRSLADSFNRMASEIEEQERMLREIDLRAAIVAAVELYSAALERRALRIELDLPAVIGARADPDHLAQVLANLLQNAVRYTPEGGRIAVSARRRDA